MPRTFHLLLATLALVATAPAVAQELGADENAPAVTMSAKDMIQGAKEALQEMSDTRDDVQEDVDAAQKAGDMETAGCVDVELKKIEALVSVSSRAQADMSTALASAQMARADHEYRKIGVARTKVRQFRAQSLICQGEGAVADGQTEIIVDTDLDDTDDTKGLGLSDGEVGVDPPNTTPFN